MTVVRQLDQPVQLLALLDCLALLVGAVISNNGVQRQAVTVDNRPTWVRDHTGGGVLLAGDVGGDAQVSESFSVRFHHHDRSGAMVTYCYYAAVDLKDPTTILVERHIECLVCTDPNDPRGTRSGLPTAPSSSRAASVMSKWPPMQRTTPQSAT
jgi:hypothetical protein